MLRPREPLDHAAAGAGDIRKEMRENNARVDREKAHYDEGTVETDQSRTFEDKTNGDGYLRTGDHPNENGCPGIGQGLIVHFPVESMEIKEFT